MTTTKPCDCARFPAMHDAAGICNNWGDHASNPEDPPRFWRIVPCTHLMDVIISAHHGLVADKNYNTIVGRCLCGQQCNGRRGLLAHLAATRRLAAAS